VAVFADPVFRADDERVTMAKAIPSSTTEAARSDDTLDLSTLPRLHFSREEANAISALAPSRVAIALDFQASRNRALKVELGSYRTVHFATHAVLDNHHPELSGIVLSMVDEHGKPQDGFLRLHEIYNLKLRADLAVLSACRTALGQEVPSEGLVGLTRGFMYAGVPQIVASLWSVQDRATAGLMRSFYGVCCTGRTLRPAS
jgi:CHAT domain-containing protein